jgi:hypothetical protein
LLRKQASGGIVLFKPCGMDFPEVAVLKRDVQPPIDERLEALFRETSNYRRYIEQRLVFANQQSGHSTALAMERAAQI